MISIMVQIKGGKIDNYQNLESALEDLNDGNHRIQIEEIKNRSLDQNKYYWKVVVPMVKDGLVDVGYNEIRTKADAHKKIKELFLVPRELPESTKELTTKEYNNLISEIQQWAAEYLSIVIPDPNQKYFLSN